MSDDRRIGDLLVDAGVISREQLEDVVAKAKLVGERRVLSELFALGLANERQLALALAQRVGAPVAVLSECVIDLDIVGVVPAGLLRDHCAIPIAADESSVTVVAKDVDAPGLMVPLGFTTGRRIVPLLGIHSILETTIEDALAAAAQGASLYVGPKASAQEPHVAVARYAPAVSLQEANDLARQIISALEEGEHRGAGGDDVKKKKPIIGAVRLRQMVIERPHGGVVERVRSIGGVANTRDPAMLRLTLDRIPEPSDDAEPGVVLVVEDDDAIRAMVAKALEHDGYTVLQAKNGEDAVTVLRLVRPHLVLLDAMLPHIHGFEICAALKRSPLRELPVIMMSGVYRGWETAREITELHGADAFVEKPFELTYLRKLVGETMKQPRLHLPPVEEIGAEVEACRRAYEDHAAHGRFDDAAAALEKWIALDPFDGRAWLERGNLSALGNDLVAAMSAYEAAVVYDSALLIAWLGLAVVYEQLGFRRRATATWLKARELAPDDAMRASIDKHLA